jgi:murein DD-endopeptidase MepM/ murein hydrolase activator NlpD
MSIRWIRVAMSIASLLMIVVGPPESAEARERHVSSKVVPHFQTNSDLRLPWETGQSHCVARDGPMHGSGRHAIDFDMRYEPVLASHSGWVVEVTWQAAGGNVITICRDQDGSQGECSIYAHLDSINVTEGQYVERGYEIGISGNTGQTTGPHLHFALISNRQGPEIPALFDEVGHELSFGECPVSQNSRGVNCCCRSFSTSIVDSFTLLATPEIFPLPITSSVPSPTPIPTLTPPPAFAPAVTPSPIAYALADSQHAIVQLNAARPSSAHYRLVRSVFGTDGGPKTSASYVMRGTSGQTSGVDWRESSSYHLQSGYWGEEFWGPAPPLEPDSYIYLPIIIK